MNSITCPECGAALKPGASLCPACLLSAGAATLPIQPVSAGITTLPCEFGDYRLLKKLGAGGMGIVYEAEQISSGRRLALKVLNQCLDNEEQRQRFLREGRLAATIDHPNSVYVFGTEEIEGVPVIAMELAAGGTLRDELKRRGTLPVSDALDAILGIIDGLEAAHARGVLHRDMKPSNCFVSSDGTAIVGDYGLSISQTNNLADGEQLTRSGMVMGTPAFSPPEQLRAQPLDLRADIYSTGGTLFYLLTGKAPVERTTPIETVAAVLEGKIPNVRTLRPEVPEDLAAVIAQCLAADVAKRPSNYAELRLALLPFSSQVSEPAPLTTRLAAGFIDSMLLMLVLVPALTFLAGTPGIEKNGAVLLSTLSVALQFLYYSGSERLRGVTPGKWLLGIAVVDLRGGLPGWRQAAMRALMFLGVSAVVSALVKLVFPGYMISLLSPGLQAVFTILLSTAAANASLLLFIPALRRRDRVAWHDQLTDTRVMLTRQMTNRKCAADTLPDGEADATRNYGPFQGIASLTEDVCLAHDPMLRRKVLLTRRHREDKPAETRRRCARPGRLRWLQAVNDDSGAVWDTWQALAGAPLSKLVQASTTPWQEVLFWLRDLSEELAVAERDSTLPTSLSLAKVWITVDGRAILLDQPWPGLPADDVATSTETAPLKTSQTFLHRIATLCPAIGRPLHADDLIQGLDAASFDRLSHVCGNVVHQLQQKLVVSMRSRAAALFGPVACVIGVMIFTMMMTQAVVETAWTSAYPGLPILPEVIKMHDQAIKPGTKDMPPVSTQHIRQHLAGHYASFFTKNAPRLPATAILPERHRVTLRGILDSTPSPTPAELEIADAIVQAELPRFQRLHPEHSSKINLAKAVPVTTFGMLCTLMFWQFACILAAGSPLQMRLSGIAVVTKQERPATRLRMLWRWCIGWSVLLVVVAVQTMRAVNGVDVIRSLPEFAQLWVPVIIIVALCGLLLPRRTLLDRLAGTWLVVR